MGPYQSEIRDSQIRELVQKVKGNNYGSYLRRIKLLKVRAFQDESVDFDFPVTALIGTNGGGLNARKDGKLLNFASVRTNLPPNIYSILEDARGDLWLGSNKGIFRINHAQVDQLLSGAGSVTADAYGTDPTMAWPSHVSIAAPGPVVTPAPSCFQTSSF